MLKAVDSLTCDKVVKEGAKKRQTQLFTVYTKFEGKDVTYHPTSEDVKHVLHEHLQLGIAEICKAESLIDDERFELYISTIGIKHNFWD